MRGKDEANPGYAPRRCARVLLVFWPGFARIFSVGAAVVAEAVKTANADVSGRFGTYPYISGRFGTFRMGFAIIPPPPREGVADV